MNEIDERAVGITENKHDRRSFLKYTLKYLVGFSTFLIASTFGLKRNGEVRLGKMKNIEFGLSEAHGACSFGSACAGGGGECSYGSSCGGDGGGGSGQCSYGSACGGGGGSCSYGSACGGGGGSCSYGSACSGGGGSCSYGSNCGGS